MLVSEYQQQSDIKLSISNNPPKKIPWKKLPETFLSKFLHIFD